MDVKLLFNANPNKFRELAKGKTYEQFIAHLQEQNNFTVIFIMNEQEKKALYSMALLG